MPDPDKSIDLGTFNLSGADPDTWGFIASVQSLGFPEKLPQAPYICTACGRDWMRTYPSCPICEAEGAVQPVETGGQADGPSH